MKSNRWSEWIKDVFCKTEEEVKEYMTMTNSIKTKKETKVTETRIDEAISNRTTAIMYGFSALIWIGCLGLNIKAIMAGTENTKDICIITAMAILSLGFMVYYIKNYVINGRIQIGFKESFRRYFEGLRIETSRRKLYAPIFIGLTICMNIVAPIALYIVDVFIKHRPVHQMDFVSSVYVASIFALVYAVLASGNNFNKEKKKSIV